MRYWSARDTTDDFRRLDVRKLQRDGLLVPWHYVPLKWSRSNGEVVGSINIHVEPDRLNLKYKARRAGEEWRDYAYAVALERTPCHMGGERVWFRCPANGCGRRVAILYGGSVFACRHCHQLTYESCRESAGDRADRRAWAIRERCGGWGGLFDPLLRPKGMHHRTFKRLDATYKRSIGTSLGIFAAKMGVVAETLRDS